MTNNFVTFGSFNSLIKINEQVLFSWAKILSAIEGSQLFLKTKLLDSNAQREKLMMQFEKLGISRDRLRLEGFSPRDQLLKSYQKIDIALDTFPYPGGTTTAESLWMGVPVLTIRGR